MLVMSLATEMAHSIMNEGVVPADWKVRDLKLLEHIMKVVERIVEGQRKGDDMQLGYMLRRGTADTIG